MLNKHEINSLVENIEWAKLDIEKGSVYHIKWAQKYVADVEFLLQEVLKWENPTETRWEMEARAEEVLLESQKS